MRPYKVQYRKINSFRWKTLENIVGDGYISPNENSVPYIPVRWFVDINDVRYELCMINMELRFSEDRVKSIAEENEKLKNNLRPI